MVHSFDIFETLISRKTATHAGIWLLVREAARKVSCESMSPALLDDFHTIREESHRLANSRSGGGEITLDDIYQSMAVLYPDISPQDCDRLKALETQAEIESVFGITDNINLVMAHLQAGERVILISDMYLSKDVVQAMLRQVEPRLAELPLYLSSESGLRKADGDLFRYVLEQEKISAAEMIHTGDDRHTDIRQAQRNGIEAIHYPGAQLNHYEQVCLLERYNLFFQLSVGASRQARLAKAAATPEYELGASFTGPLFFGFVHDAIRSTLERGEKTVYFLARDGYLLKAMAEVIIAKCAYEIKARYIYVSRKSLYPAGFFNLNGNELWWLFEEMDSQRSAALVADRLNLTGSDRALILNDDMRRSTGIDHDESRLSDKQTTALIDYIKTSADLRKVILSQSELQRKRLIEYFRSEGLLEQDRLALVDIGWRGTLQDAIFRLLKEEKPSIKITEHYFGISRYSSLTSEDNRKIPYVMYASNRPTVAPVLEHILQADHGTTTGHAMDENGLVRPVLKELAHEQSKWNFPDYIGGVEAFAAVFCQSLNATPSEMHFEAISNLLREIADEGDKQLAETLGDLAYCGSQEEHNLRRLAPPLSVGMALKYIFSSPRQKLQFTQWRQGSYLRSAPLAKAILKLEPLPLAKRVLEVFLEPGEIRQIPGFARSLVRSIKGKTALLKK